MTAPAKSSTLQAYRHILFRRALHPELFEVKGRRSVEHGEYEFEAWIMPGAHLLRFQFDGLCGTELLIDREIELSDRGLVDESPCAGERDFEHPFSDRVNYLGTIQTESLPLNLYTSTYNELVEFGTETDAMMHQWIDEDGGKCASILDIQRFRREVHAQAYHLIADGSIVIRSQSIFEHK